MKLGVVGLPNVGKSTLFNAITQAGAESANYPFCTIEPNTGIVAVPDARLNVLAEMYRTKKIVPATVEFVDIAGLVRGASKGEGLGNKFLSHIREVDAIVHVVRCFEDGNIVHVDGDIDPVRDMETINIELIFADMETITKRVDKARKMKKSGEKKYEAEAELGERLLKHLESGQSARSFDAEENEKEILRDWLLLTMKPVLYCANIGEDDIGAADLPMADKVLEAARKEGAGTITISARIEEEISRLDAEEKEEFLGDLGLESSGLDRMVVACYALLGQISYLTAGEPEVRAWTITRGMKAPQAAGKIHTDFERGFIRAEVVPYEALAREGSMAVCKEKGLVRSEGKEYVVQDGDVILFRFNV